jgi:hypothetical protein
MPVSTIYPKHAFLGESTMTPYTVLTYSNPTQSLLAGLSLRRLPANHSYNRIDHIPFLFRYCNPFAAEIVASQRRSLEASSSHSVDEGHLTSEKIPASVLSIRSNEGKREYGLFPLYTYIKIVSIPCPRASDFSPVLSSQSLIPECCVYDSSFCVTANELVAIGTNVHLN